MASECTRVPSRVSPPVLSYFSRVAPPVCLRRPQSNHLPLHSVSPVLPVSFFACPSPLPSLSERSLTHTPRYNTFASAGSDGTVSIWDHKSKKRLRQYSKYPAPVPSIAFNCDGSRLAVGVSYTGEEGEEGAKTAPRPAVMVKSVGEEVKVRARRV